MVDQDIKDCRNLMQESLQTKHMVLKNRLVMPPMATKTADVNGGLTPEIFDYYGKRGAGGDIGLIITEHSYVDRQGRARFRQPSIAQGCDLDAWKRLAEAIKKDGSRAVMQINHVGSSLSEDTGEEMLAPSAVKNPSGSARDTLPKAMTTDDIRRVEEHFTKAAVRAKEAGFDGVEIHSAHGYLLNQFFSPLTNQRTDEYGVDCMENRIRIHVEIIRMVRAATGEDFPILLRLGGCDYMPGGSTIEDAVKAANVFEKEGIEILDLSGGMCRFTRKGHMEAGYFRDLSTAVKNAVSIPVILTGGVTEIGQAQELLKQGCADLIGVGRAILKDADWARKAMNYGK